jgi:hypothetical protein
MKRIAIHQPEYWPLPRLLAKWAVADLLIVLDIVQFDRSSLQHRARFQSRFDGAYRWLTVPFAHIGTPQQIRVLEPVERNWAVKHWARLREWYRGVEPERLDAIAVWFETQHQDHGQAISTYTLESMKFLATLVGIQTPYVLASALIPPTGGWGGKSDLVLNLCKASGAGIYLAGVRGATYLDWAAFERLGISIEVQAYMHPTSEPELSALHTYFEAGLEPLVDLVTRKVITTKQEETSEHESDHIAT